MNAFERLNVPKTADDTVILNAYLQQLRDCPPEKDPQQFEKIRAAYEAIQDERKRIHYELFGVEEVDILDIVQALIGTRTTNRPAFNKRPIATLYSKQYSGNSAMNDEIIITAPKQAPDSIENAAADSECPAANPVNIESEQEFCLPDMIKQPTPLLKELLIFLNSNDATALNQAGDQPIDLYHLFTELATMKTELKYASRQMKTGLEEFKQVFSTLQQCNTSLTAELEQRATRERQQIDAENSDHAKTAVVTFDRLARQRRKIPIKPNTP